MKELTNHDKLSEKQSTEIQVKKNQQVEYLYDSTVRPMPGHTVFEIDLKTLKASPAEYVVHQQIDWFEALRDFLNPAKAKVKDIVRRKGCVYVAALNAETAIERYLNGKGSAKLSTEQKALA